MRSRIIDAQALRSSIVATAKGSERVAGKVTRKGQASALANGLGNRLVQVIEKQVWASPMGFAAFADAEGYEFASYADALDAIANGDNAEALVALEVIKSHRAYRAERFDEAFTTCDIERLVRREIGYQRSGGINLGLAGYSADDVVMMAVARAHHARVIRYFVATSVISADDADAYKQALNQRSLADFSDAIEASDLVSYTIRTDKNGYSLISKKDVSKINERIVDRANKFFELAGMVNEETAGLEFSIGDVYREILKVRREGISAIRRMLEGHTFDGTFTPSVEASASERETYGFRSQVDANLEYSLTVASAEETVITRKFTVQDERAELIDSLRKRDLLPIEAEAVAFTMLLNRGFSLEELAEKVFVDVSARKFNEIQRAAQDLFRK